jgi:hypothetical protein
VHQRGFEVLTQQQLLQVRNHGSTA